MDTPDSTTLKRCPKCGEWKSRAEFGVDNRRKDGVRLWCKACSCESTKQYYKANADKRREYSRRYHESHLDKEQKRKRLYYEAHANEAREYSRQYYKTNKDKIGERIRRYYEANADEMRERSCRWNAANPEKVREKERRYRASNPDVRRAGNRNRHARKLAIGGTHNAADIEAIRIAQGNRCYLCGKTLKKYHVDHFIPLALGGTNDSGNLRLACPKCNLSKSAKHPFELGRLL